MKKLCVIVLLAVLIFSAGTWAQVGTSSVTGTVTDKTGAVIAGARVIVTNEATGVAHEAQTTDAGVYTFSALVVGSYSIRVEMTGFQKWVSTKNVMTVGSPLVVNASLEVGALSSVVTVESTYQRLETTNAAIGNVITQNQVKNLPLNGRNPLSLLTLEPGVVQRTFGGAGSGTHVFGSRDRAHNVTIDGIDANESTVPNPQGNIQRLNPDNVQEFRTVTLGATAENGRNSGANVMVATKSGTNELHGAAYYFNRNTALAANEWFNNATNQKRPDLKLNQWGGDVGGPIWKNKTFFFGSYQGNNIKQSAPIVIALGGTPTVYTTTAKSGIFRFVRGTVVTPSGVSLTQNDKRLVDSSGILLPGIATCVGVLGGSATGNCVDGYDIFSTAINPVSLLPNVTPGITSPDPAVAALFNRMPAPNSFTTVGDGLNTAGFSWNPPTKFVGPHFMVRVDHNFGAKDNIFVRWLQNRYDTTQGDFINARPMVFPGFPPLGEVTRIGRNLSISYRHVFTPALVNELTLGFNRFAFAFTFGESNPGFGDPTKNPPWADSCIYGSFGNITGPYCASPHTQRAVTTPQIIDNVSWSHGAHTFRAGINFRFYLHNDSRGFFGGTVAAPGIIFNAATNARRDSFSNIPFGAGVTLPNIVDMNVLHQTIVELAGIPFSLRQSFQADFNADKYVGAKYATVYTRARQYNSYLQDEWKLRPNLVLNLGVRWEYNPSPFDKRQSLVPNRDLLGSQGPVTFAKAKKWFGNDNITAIAPRVGLAWSPDSKTSIRVGYALLFDTISTFQVTAIAGKMPGFMLGCQTNTDTAGAVSFSPGCVAASGTTNQISSGFPLSIPAPTTTPSGVTTLLLQNQPSNLAPAIGAFDQNMKNPAVHEWNLTIQRELPSHIVAEVGFIGKRGTHLQRAYDLNQVDISSQFLSSFIIARNNFLQGCNPSTGTGALPCPVGGTGQTPAYLLSLVLPGFINGQGTILRRGGVGDLAAAMDALATNNTSRFGVPSGSPSTIPPTFVLRPNGQFGQIFYQDSGGDSWYHGVYFAARRRFEKGLDFGLSYTFSRSEDMLSADPTGAATGGGLSTTSFQRTPTDVRNFKLDKSRSDFNNTHVWQGNVLYELPFGKGRRFASSAPGWLNQVIGGWTLTTIYVYQSGEPYTLSSGARTSNGTHNSTGMMIGQQNTGGFLLPSPPGVTGPVLYRTGAISTILTDPHLNCQNATGTGTYFCIPPPGQNGDGRNTLDGPHYWNVDMGILKVFDLTERFKLQFRAELFNALNHPNFENPRNSSLGSSTVTSSAFGQTCCSTAAIASAQQVNPVGEPMRVVQIGLKLNF